MRKPKPVPTPKGQLYPCTVILDGHKMDFYVKSNITGRMVIVKGMGTKIPWKDVSKELRNTVLSYGSLGHQWGTIPFYQTSLSGTVMKEILGLSNRK